MTDDQEKSAGKRRLLIVDDNERMLLSWQRALKSDFEIILARSAKEAREEFKTNPDVALLDIRLDENDHDNREGVELLRSFLKINPDLPVVMISAYGDVSLAVECITLGAADFVEKTAALPEIRQRLLKAFQQGRFYRRAKFIEAEFERKTPQKIVGQSKAIRELKEMIHFVARDGTISVIIRGETGTGKELVAKSIYKLGRRSGDPFVPVSIATIPEQLIASELFGHEAGAFTDAKQQKKGLFELANGGVLFLDEIGDLSIAAQVKLLRVLEEKQLTRLGSTTSIKFDAQILSATNQDLRALIDDGQFRDDLYFRLKGLEILLPPLRERKEDLSLLVEHFLSLLRQQGRTRIEKISDEALQGFHDYSWPGNVRELSRVIESAAFYAELHDHQQIEIDDLPKELVQASSSISPIPKPIMTDDFDLSEHLARTELACIEEALKSVDGRKTSAFKLLGLNDRFALHRRVNVLVAKYPLLINEFAYVKKLYGK